MLLYFSEHQVRYAKIPKNACSTVINSLGHAIVQDRSPHQFDHHFRQPVAGSEGWPLLAVLRDPYERLVSAYLNKLVIPSKREPFAGKLLDAVWKHQRETERTDPLASITFAEFVKFVCARQDNALDQHWQSQTHHLDGADPQIVLDMKNMRAGWLENPILSKIELRDFAPHATKSDIIIERDLSRVDGNDIASFFRVARKFPPQSAFYNARLFERVRERYAADYELRNAFGLEPTLTPPT
ncbi:sulfotransferase family protein [Paracoccus sp. M683]|uniref:sulfotransferase family 2 domain-containing protein n=1 Tax=Paracoccus sp. M683 TaxID=2594268 RepID=UPI00117CE47F|nr:sulfotransferase family 2 domain-containing protein [Paracoccus sp. M683]TRW92930.1 sulfotransferase family protein [Paracoccus sp. M683]